MSTTGIRQRHRKGCDRLGRCRCPWSYTAEVARAADGKRVQLTRSGYATQKEAKRERERAIREHTAAPTLTDRRSTVAVYLDRWLTRREDGGRLRSSTINGYRDIIRRFLAPTLGNIRLGDLNTEHVARAFRTIRTQHPDLSPASLQRIRACLRAALRDALGRGQIVTDPSAALELPEVPEPPITLWQPEQFGAFLDHPHVASHRLSVAVLLAGLAGLRRGEVAGLSWQDVNLDAGRLTVNHQAVVTRTPRTNPQPGQSRYEVSVTITAPKSRAGTGRTVDLDSGTVAALRTWRAQQSVERLAWGPAWQDTGLVITREDGRGYDPSNMGKVFSRLVKQARFTTSGQPVSPGQDGHDDAEPLPPIKFHSLRHLAASLALAAGVPLAAVSKRLGHSTVALTADTYSHLLAGVGAQAAEASAALVPRRQYKGL